MDQDSEFLLLNSINELTRKKADISQRDLAKAINLSLGMTNVLLRRLSEKGLILIQKVSARNVTYILTPDGINALAGKTYRYLKRTMKTVVIYKETIVKITKEARRLGFTHIGLLGKSDIDFIIEYAAGNSGLPFSVFQEDAIIPGDTFVFVSENYPGNCPVSGTAAANICDLLSGEN
jgi:predicted transcriptional regulator